MKFIENRNEEDAMGGYELWGPTFEYGIDLDLTNNCNTNADNYCKLGWTHSQTKGNLNKN